MNAMKNVTLVMNATAGPVPTERCFDTTQSAIVPVRSTGPVQVVGDVCRVLLRAALVAKHTFHRHGAGGDEECGRRRGSSGQTHLPPARGRWGVLNVATAAAAAITLCFVASSAARATDSPAKETDLSGAAWWHANQAKYPNSTKVDDLEPKFRAKVKAFLAALADAGIHPNIESTLRSKQRAYLMHYCWEIAHGTTPASKVPPYSGIKIVWDHGDAAKSKKAAQEMVDLFEMDYMASLTSNHIKGLAIDMKFSWKGTLKIKKKDGTVVEIKTTPRNGADNKLMHAVGASYGVIKLVGDAPHWSVDGK